MGRGEICAAYFLVSSVYVAGQLPYAGYGNYASNQRESLEKTVLLGPSPAGYIESADGSLTKCTAGFYCNPGTSDASQMIACGSVDVFCPEGSVAPTAVDAGYYTIGDTADVTKRTGEKICEPGSYCEAGVKYDCPAGSWGIKFGETSNACDGLCHEGFKCTAGSTSPKQLPCGDPSAYCGFGSHNPVTVQVGYYSTGGQNPNTRTGESITEVGHFSVDGLKYPCPAGRYGATEGLSDSMCSGECEKGYFCPPGSTHHSQNYCGSEGVFCPRSSIAPTRVWDGHYTTVAGVDDCGPGRFRNTTNVVDPTISPVQIGSVTPTKVPVGQCDLCPFGKYKARDGDDKSLCLACPYYSTNAHGESVMNIGKLIGNSTKDRTSCVCYRADGGAAFDQLYFNVTTGSCDAVPLGYVSPDTHEAGISRRTRYEQFECEVGHYCVGGIRYECGAGRYGERRRETSSLCSGVCDEGYYCPTASSSKRENKCGGADLFCPSNSSTPTRVLENYYTNEEVGEDVRSSQSICPPGYYCQGGRRYKCAKGYYGKNTGNTKETCDGKCRPGYFCLEGSISSTQNQCGGSHVYCPEGSFEPTPVSESYYTVAGQIDLYLRDKVDVMNMTMSKQSVCEPGFWCSGGVKHQCPQGTWSNNYGMRDPSNCDLCEEGYYCPSYPLRPSTTPTRYECGRVDVYCPAGSHSPINVTVGHYTYGGDERNTTRVGEAECEEAHYCKNGVKRICREGVYGGLKGMTSEDCMGICPAGHMCPTGTATPIPCGVGEYSGAGSWKCNSCGPNSQAEGDEGSQRCKDSRKCCFR
mmetsp:Transcript_22905/g.47502  ORF Transcript_22905/g.47502 Transcript_22905/m.47502 type:complete len:806 (-) Transcript_22905:6-2423(-)